MVNSHLNLLIIITAIKEDITDRTHRGCKKAGECPSLLHEIGHKIGRASHEYKRMRLGRTTEEATKDVRKEPERNEGGAGQRRKRKRDGAEQFWAVLAMRAKYQKLHKSTQAGSGFQDDMRLSMGHCRCGQ